MSSQQRRSSSLGAVPHKKPLARSRAQSSAASPLEVRCACQFFQCDSLIPERVNPIGTVGSASSTRPQSRIGEHQRSINCSSQNIIEEEEAMNGSCLSFGKTSVPDYYGETSNSPVRSPERAQPPQYQPNFNFNRPQTPQLTSQTFHHPLSQKDFQNRENSLPPTSSHGNQPLSFEGRNIPSIEIESFRRDPTPIIAPTTARKMQIDNVYSSREFRDELTLTQIENENGVGFDDVRVDEGAFDELRGRSMDRRNIKAAATMAREMRESSQPAMMMSNQTYSSQKSLDRYSNSVLLNRYRQKSQSRSNSQAPSMNDVRFPPRMVKTVSFDYGKPSNGGVVSNAVIANQNFDQYHRMSPMVFHVRERLQKIEQFHNHKQQEGWEILNWRLRGWLTKILDKAEFWLGRMRWNRDSSPRRRRFELISAWDEISSD